MWSLLTRNWNPSSIYEITSTVNNRTSKSTAKTAKEMNNFTFYVGREMKKMAYSLNVKRRPIHTQTCAVTLSGENELPVAS